MSEASDYSYETFDQVRIANRGQNLLQSDFTQSWAEKVSKIVTSILLKAKAKLKQIQTPDLKTEPLPDITITTIRVSQNC